MSYALVEIDLTKPLPTIVLSGSQRGVGLILRARHRPVGFAMRCYPPNATITPDEIAGIIRGEAIPDLTDETAAADWNLNRTRAALGLPPLTVAICTRDHPELLTRCLNALTAAVCRHRAAASQIEILVVDNASASSATRDVVSGFPTARYIREPRPGLDFARNKALQEAEGEFVLFIDDDVVIDSGWLDGFAEAWMDHPDAGAFTGQVLPLELDTGAQVLAEQLGGFRKGWQRRRFEQADENDPLYPCTTAFGNGCNMAFRKELALKLGGFDEALDTGRSLPGGGDLDMLYRVVRAGHPLVYEPSFLVFHEHRRTHRQLRSQVCRSWGLGCMAFLIKICRTDPAQKSKADRFIRWWFQDMNGRLRRRLRGAESAPVDLILAELWGALLGYFGGYTRSQKRIARLRRQFP